MDNLDTVWVALGGIGVIGIAAFIGMWLLSRAERRPRDSAADTPNRETR